MAIDELLDEHEQGERVRSWLRNNGAGMIGGVLLGLALIGGWQWWQKQRDAQLVATGEHFQAAIDSIQAGNLKRAQPQVSALPEGTYHTLAQLELAKAQVNAGQLEAAIATLRGAKSQDAALSGVVSSRLARLLVDAGKAKDALSMLPAESNDPTVQQVRGDALHALGQDEQARAAYERALTHLDVGAPQRAVVELKLSEVGGTPASPEAKT